MVYIGKESGMSPDQVLREAIKCFGPRGAGLQVLSTEDGFARFAGGDRFINLHVSPAAPGSQVDLESDDWIEGIESFLAGL